MPRKFRPANGTDGDIFEAAFCDRCGNEEAWRRTQDPDRQCGIHTRAIFEDIDSLKYPSEWHYDDRGRPTCSAFVPNGYAGKTPRQLNTSPVPDWPTGDQS